MDDPIKIGKGPKKLLVETFHTKILNGLHTVVFASGEEQFTFVFPLPLAKALGRAVTSNIQELEKRSGKEIGDLILSNEPVPSPVIFKSDGDNSKGNGETKNK